MAPHVQPTTEPTIAEATAWLRDQGIPLISGAETAPAGGDGGEGGQGGEAGAGLYDLSQFAPEIREQVEPAFKQFDANVTKKFQEHAEAMKQWQPYNEIGLTEHDPEYVQQLLEFGDTLQDQDSFKEWLHGIAEEHGEALGISLADSGGGLPDDGGLDDFGDMSEEQIQKIVDKRVQDALQPFQQQHQQQQLEAQQKEVLQQLETRMAEVTKEAGVELDEQEQEIVYSLANKHYGSNDPIGLAFKDYQEIIGKAEKGLLGRKAQVPRGAEGPGGGAPTNPDERPTTFEEARKQATERIRQSIHG